MLDVSPNGAGEDGSRLRQRVQLEIAVILAVAVVPDVLHAVISLVEPRQSVTRFWIDAIMLIQRSLTVSAVALFFIWSSGHGWKRFGFTAWRWRVDLPLVLVLFVVGWLTSGFVYSAAAMILPVTESAIDYFDQPASKPDLLLLLFMSVANGFAEELVIWGFLFTRLSSLAVRPVSMIPVCAAIFASYHIYQGPAAMVSIFSIGLLHGLCYWRVGRLWPLVVTHALWDFIVYLLWSQG